MKVKRRGPSASAASCPSAAWAHLPSDLLHTVFDRLYSVADIFAVAGVCRSWRAVSRRLSSSVIAGRCPPLLLAPDDGLPGRCCLLSPADPAASYRCSVRSEALSSDVIGCSYGHLIFYSRNGPVSLADVVTGHELRLFELPLGYSLHHGILTAPPSDSDCSVLLLGSHFLETDDLETVLFRWQVDTRRCSEHTLGSEEPIIRITVFRSQIFVLGRWSLFKVEFYPHFSARLWMRMMLPEVSILAPITQVLVQCGGDLMLVLVLFEKVKVFRLDLSARSCVRTKSIGERALFLDKLGCSVSCPNPSTWGGRSNCLYLASPTRDTWIEWPLENKAVYHKSPLYQAERNNRMTLKLPGPIWVYPSNLYMLHENCI